MLFTMEMLSKTLPINLRPNNYVIWKKFEENFEEQFWRTLFTLYQFRFKMTMPMPTMTMTLFHPSPSVTRGAPVSLSVALRYPLLHGPNNLSHRLRSQGRPFLWCSCVDAGSSHLRASWRRSWCSGEGPTVQGEILQALRRPSQLAASSNYWKGTNPLQPNNKNNKNCHVLSANMSRGVYLFLQLILSYVADKLSGNIMNNSKKEQNNVVLASVDQLQTLSITFVHGMPLLVTVSSTSPGLLMRHFAAVSVASAFAIADSALASTLALSIDSAFLDSWRSITIFSVLKWFSSWRLETR